MSSHWRFSIVRDASMPLNVALAVHDALMTGPESQIELFHGYTYSGHPIACAAGIAALDIYRDEGLFSRAKEMQREWDDAIHGLKGLPNVIDIRTIGLIAGIELAPRSGTAGARAFAAGARAYDVFVECLGKGVLIRVTGDIIALSPPLIIEKTQIGEMVTVLGDVLRTVA
jgi:beta-alanine--pyruvate transaminase